MWKLLLLTAAVIAFAGISSSQSQPEYLTIFSGWVFYKVPVTGTMTNTNVKATCEAAGMRYPCYDSGSNGSSSYWGPGCITYEHTYSYYNTHQVLSRKLCGLVSGSGSECQPLDDTFVYCPNCWNGDSAWGVDFDSNSGGLQGAKYNDKYALCAAEWPW